MNCTRLEELDEVTFGENITSANDWIKNTNLKYVNNMTLKNNYVKFKDCATLIECNNLKLTGNANSISELFYYCSNLVTCNMTSDNVINAVYRCFEACEKLERFIVPELTDNVDLYRMFTHCYAITYIEFYDKVMDLTRLGGLGDRNYQAFTNCHNLETIKNFKVKYYPTDAEKELYINDGIDEWTENSMIDAVAHLWSGSGKIKNTTGMGIYNDWAKILFFRYRGDISEFIIGDEVTDISYLFRGRPRITKDIAIPNHVTNCSDAFKGCTSMTHIHSNWNNSYSDTIVSDGCYSGCIGITHIDNSELILDEYSTCLDNIPEEWGGYGFEDSNTSVVVLDIPSDNYEVTVTMRVDFGDNSVLFSKPPLIAWGDNSTSVGDYVLGVTATKDFSHTYAQAGKYVVKLKNGTFCYNDTFQHPSFRDNIYKIVSLHDKFPIAYNHFRDSSKLVEANISNAVMIGGYQFMSCPNLTKVIANNVKAISIVYCFRVCSNLTEIIGLDTWNTDELTNMRCAFATISLTSLDDMADWNTENVVDMNSAFDGMRNITNLDFMSNWNFNKVTDMGNIFLNCYSLTSVDLSGWDITTVTNLSGMFGHCSSLTSVDLSGWNVGKVTAMSGMFSGCSSLTSINMEGWDTGNVSSMQDMFLNCSSLTFETVASCSI